MRIFWSTNAVPELTNVDRRQRGCLWRRFMLRTSFRHWQFWAGLASCGVFIAAGVAFTGVAGVDASLFGSLIIGAFGGVGGVCLTQLLFQPFREYIRRQYPQLCHGCGYDLRATMAANGPACPECGEPITARQLSHFK